jgi:hypothetical protein
LIFSRATQEEGRRRNGVELALIGAIAEQTLAVTVGQKIGWVLPQFAGESDLKREVEAEDVKWCASEVTAGSNSSEQSSANG